MSIAAPQRQRRSGPIALAVGLLVALALLSAVHLSQGSVDLSALTSAVLLDSRLPRLLAAVSVGLALGVCGSILQSLARNPLASPDTLAVNAGAQLAVTVGAVTGLGSVLAGITVAGTSVGAFAGAIIALVGGLAGAGAVLLLSRGGAGSGTRLVLAGTALTLAIGAGGLTGALLLLFSEATTGLYAWGAGTLTQAGLGTVAQLAPVMAIIVALVWWRAPSLDLLALGDDSAAGLGLRVGRTRVGFTVGAVALAALAVAVAGPIGFVGLCAPAAVRLLAGREPGLARARAQLPIAGLAGATLLLGADVALRALLGPLASLQVPTGVVTSLLGAVFLVVLARTLRTGDTADAAGLATGTLGWGRRHARVVLVVACAALLGAGIGAVLVGEVPLLLGDVVTWMSGRANALVDIVLSSRVPRVTAALGAGAALALAGALTQAITRNPLADPAILGLSPGAALGGVLAVTVIGTRATPVLFGCAALGAAAAGTVLFALAGRRTEPTRLVLVGIGISTGATALIQLVIAATNPWDQTAAITWLGGSTYGTSLTDQLPLLLALILAAIVAVGLRADLDLLQLDDDTPRLGGVSPGRTRAIAIGCIVLLTATATMAVGLIAFVGLVAPHAARLLVGPRHGRLLGLSAVLGAVLVVIADAIGRTVIAPGQLPAGMMTAVVGAPYFLWLLRRLSAPSGGSR